MRELYAGLIDEALDSVQQRVADAFTSAFSGWFSSWFAWMHDPLTFWIICLIALFLVCVVIGWFLPFKWIRAGLGVVLLLAGTFFAGGYVMRKQIREQQEKEAAKRVRRKR